MKAVLLSSAIFLLVLFIYHIGFLVLIEISELLDGNSDLHPAVKVIIFIVGSIAGMINGMWASEKYYQSMK